MAGKLDRGKPVVSPRQTDAVMPASGTWSTSSKREASKFLSNRSGLINLIAIARIGIGTSHAASALPCVLAESRGQAHIARDRSGLARTGRERRSNETAPVRDSECRSRVATAIRFHGDF